MKNTIESQTVPLTGSHRSNGSFSMCFFFSRLIDLFIHIQKGKIKFSYYSIALSNWQNLNRNE